MFKKAKKFLSGIIAASMLVACAGCQTGKSTAYALTIDGYQVKAGVYIYYSYSALQEAISKAQNDNEDLDTSDESALKKTKIEGKDFMEWVEDKATSNCAEHVAVIGKFDEMELEISEEDLENVENYVESAFAEDDNTFEENGIGEESFEEILMNTYKSEAVFNAIFGEDGTENVQESEIKDYYIENNARVKYIGLDLHDAEGNDLDDAGIKEIENMADDFLERAKSAGSTDDMLAEFDKMQTEYDEFVADEAAEANEEETTEETTEEATEEPTEETLSNDEDTADDENDETVETDVASDEDEETTTTTTTNPYANETIVTVVTTNEGTAEEDVTYNPSKTFYDWVYNDAKTNTPEIIKDDDTIYVAVRLDITERMTDDDLWTETAVESVRFKMFSEDFQNVLDEWVEQCTIERNEKAYKRYDPFEFKTA